MQFLPDRAFFARYRVSGPGHGTRWDATRRRLSALVLGVLLAVAPDDAAGQLATLRGRVVDRSDDQPLPGAAVVLEHADEGQRIGTAADGNGYFVLGRIQPGRYVLTVSFVGYVPWSDTLQLDFGDSRDFDVRLEPTETELNEVVVESQRETSGMHGTSGFTTVRPSELTRLPMPGLSADLARYVQSMPGVFTAGDRGGMPFVRGGTPTQNLVLVDGMPVYQPFHIIGFYSAVPADIVAYADVYTGGFGARYGGWISSVLDVATRNGHKQRVAGAISLAPFLGGVRLELPLVPERVSILASARESVIERLAPDLLGEDLPYRFGDRFVKLHAFLNRTSSFSLTAIRTLDRGDVAHVEGHPSRMFWQNDAYGGQYVYLPEEFPALTSVRVFISRLDSRFRPFDASERTTSIETIGGEARLTYYLTAGELRFGLFARSHTLAFDLGSRGAEQEEFVTEGGLFLETPFRVGAHLRVEPGLRLHSFPSRAHRSTAFEPRLRLAWRPAGRTSPHVLSAAWGRYHQQIVGLYNTQSLSDAFIAWSPSPPTGRVPRATHVLAGWEGPLARGLTADVEAYLKIMTDLSFATFGNHFEEGIQVDAVEGRARGVDLKLTFARPWLHSSISYSLSSVRYTQVDTPKTHFPAPHDRRHQIHALVRVERGPYAFGLAWQFGSGLPFTQAVGFYDAVPVESPEDTGYRTHPGVPVFLTDETPYAERLPAYHRLDASLERRFTWSHVTATVQAAVVNAYDRANLFDYDLFAGRRVNQLPLIPTLGVHIEWQ